MRLLALFLLCAPAWAAVDGAVVNRTSGKPQPGAMVMLFKLGGPAGPEMVATTTADAQGRFSLAQSVNGPGLIEVQHGGVNYTRMLAPGMPASGVEVDIFDSSRKAAGARMTQHMVVLEPSAAQLTVNESFFFTNDGNVTWHDPENGTLRFVVPDAAKDSLKVQAQAPQGMAVERTAEAAGEPGAYKVNFAIKPGETRFDVSYVLPPATSFTGRTLAPGVPTRIAVPSGVTLTGEGLQSLGREPSTQAAVFEVAAADFKLEFQGSGSLRTAAAPEEETQRFSEVLPGMYERLPWILVPALLILMLGFAMLYQRGAARR